MIPDIDWSEEDRHAGIVYRTKSASLEGGLVVLVEDYSWWQEKDVWLEIGFIYKNEDDQPEGWSVFTGGDHRPSSAGTDLHALIIERVEQWGRAMGRINA